MSDVTVSFVRSMVARFSKLKALLAGHIEDNEGEILPHVFFGDLTRYVVSLALAAGGAELPLTHDLHAILEYLEEAYASGGDEVQELIAVSFLENLPRPAEPGAWIREIVGPSLCRQLQRMEFTSEGPR